MAWLRKEMLMTTGYSFDGYSITEYKQVITGECVIGTGFLSDLSAVVNDFFGTTSNTLSRKLDEARAYATQNLVERAENLGANAVIGVDFDYITLAGNMLAVIANGTAVYVKSNSLSEKEIKSKEIVTEENKKEMVVAKDDSVSEQRVVYVDRSKRETQCPFCNKIQKANRNLCYNCGVPFVDATDQ